MRVTNEMMYRMLASNVELSKEAAYKIQQQTASGKKVERPSDDPLAFDKIQQLKTDNSRIQQYARNAADAGNDLLNLDTILQDIISILQRSSEVAVNAGDGTIENFDGLAAEVDQLLENLVSLANSRDEGGGYIFSGLRTDTPAYAITRTDGMITAVTYQGGTGVRQAEIGKENYVSVTIPGGDSSSTNAVFQTSSVDLFTNLIQLRDRLLANEQITATETFTADAATDTLTTQNVYTTGSMVTLSSDGALPGGLSADIAYYAIKVSDTEIKLAATLQDAKNGIALDILDAGTGAHTIRQDTLQELDAGLDHIIDTLSAVGAREERVNLQQKLLSNRETNLQTMLADEESIDLAKAAIELSAKQSAYEAALGVTSKVLNQVSLIDFI